MEGRIIEWPCLAKRASITALSQRQIGAGDRTAGDRSLENYTVGALATAYPLFNSVSTPGFQNRGMLGFSFGECNMIPLFVSGAHMIAGTIGGLHAYCLIAQDCSSTMLRDSFARGVLGLVGTTRPRSYVLGRGLA